jgi:imidazolonepropionase-like amidohydrolase
LPEQRCAETLKLASGRTNVQYPFEHLSVFFDAHSVRALLSLFLVIHMRTPSVSLSVNALRLGLLCLVLTGATAVGAQATSTVPDAVSPVPVLLVPDRVFDGSVMRQGVVVLVDSGRVRAIGQRTSLRIPGSARVIELPGTTLMPGLIDLHSHVLLHPYNEVPWDDQVLREAWGERVARATVHLSRTLDAGFTTLRDLGTEGAGSSDVGLRSALEKGVIRGPRLIVAEQAIVMRGSYAPRGFAPEVRVPVAAEEAGNTSELVAAVRGQIARGADVIKVYADYRWGPNGSAAPAFTIEELQAAVAIANSSGRPVIAHASTAEGMRRATLAGVQTIEHGDGGTAEVFALMKERGVVLVPTVAAGHAIAQYGGWRQGVTAEPARVRAKRASVRAALDAGVTIANGSDVGVFAHGDNARELEILVEYGMTPVQALTAATSTAARVLGLERTIGTVAPGAMADLVIVQGDPSAQISAVRKLRMVLQRGAVVYLAPR